MVDYYVSTAGNDGNAGTVGAPWATINYAANSSVAANGDRILLVAGQTFNQDVNITRARTITIRSSDIYNPAIVVPQTIELRVMANGWTLEHFIVNGAGAPAGTMGVRFGSGTTTVDNCTIQDMVVKHFPSHAIHARNVTNFTARRNIIYDCRTRISAGAGAHGVYCATRMNTAQIYKNYIFDMGADGYQCDAGITSVSGVQIYDNVIFVPRPYGSRNWHDFLTNVGETGIDIKASAGGLTITRNRIYGIYATVANQDSGGSSNGSALDVHVEAQNVDVIDNLVWNCGIGYACGQGGGAVRNENIRFISNIIIDPTNANGGPAIGISFSFTNGLVVENNSIICGGAGDLYVNQSPDVAYVRVRNNIFYRGTYSRSATAITGEANWVHNTFPNVTSGPPAAWNADLVSAPTPAFDAEYVPGASSSFINAGHNMALIRDAAGVPRGVAHTMGGYELRASQPSNQNLFGELPGLYGYLPGMFTTFTDADGEINLYPIRELTYGFGIAVKIQDTTAHYFRRTIANSPTVRHRFYLEPKLFQMANSSNLIICNLRRSGTPHTRIELRYTGGSFYIVASTDTDAPVQTYIGTSAGFAITRAAQRIEFQLTAATAPGSNNGTFQLWIDGVSQGSLTGLDNDTQTTDELGWGAITIPASCGSVEEEFGTFWMHSLAANNNGVEIGAVVDSLPALPVVLNTDSGLRAAYDLAEASGTRVDWTSYNNDLADINTVGNIGDSADFERDNAEMLTNETPTGLNITAAVSLVVRLTPESLPGFMYIISKWAPTSNLRQYRLAINTSNLFDFAISANGVADVLAVSGSPAVAGVSYWVAGVYDGQVLWVLVDGVRSGAPVFSTVALFTGASAFRLGASGNAGSYYDGLIDEAYVFNRAISTAEFAGIIAAGGLNAPTGGSPITGAASNTLGVLTLAASGGGGALGIAAITLGALTLTATASAPPPPPETVGAVATSASVVIVRIGLVVGNQLRPKKSINFRGN
jgi:hypothetical protein